MKTVVFIISEGQHGIYAELAKIFTSLEQPTTGRMIAGFIRDRGFNVEIIDGEALKLSDETIATMVKDLNPVLVIIVVAGHQPSASTQAMPAASDIAKAIKALTPNQKIIMTGNHVSALPVQTLQEEAVDYVCDGEGPETIFGLLQLRKYGSLADIPGLVWRGYDSDHFLRNSPAPLIENLDKDLHGNVWDLLPMDKYRAHSWQCFSDLSKRQPYASIYTTLGCPYKCNFCMINSQFHSNRYRRFSPKFIVTQMLNLYQNYGVETFKFADEMFILNENHYTEICNSLIESGLGNIINVWAYARVDTVKPHTLDLLRRAGIQWLALGIESGSKHVRDGAEKRLRTDDIVGIVKTIQSAGINVIGNFMFGLPDDNLDTMQQTLDLALECMPDFANWYSCMAYPGSTLYTQAVKEGKTLPDNWAGYSQHNKWCRPLDTEHVDAATVLQFRDTAFKKFFTNESYQLMVKNKFGGTALDHIKEMLKYDLPRNLLSNGEK